MNLTRTLALSAALLVPSAAVAEASVAESTTAQVTIIRTGGSTGLQLLAVKLKNSYRAATVTVTGGGSGAGIRGAASGQFDIGNSSRDPAPSDPKGLVFTPIAKEPFAVIVNKANPLRTLTQAQIKGIFTGSITNWSQVGWGAGGAIRVYSRIGTSGTLASFRKLFLDDEAVTSSAATLASNALDRAAVAGARNGISFVTLAYVSRAIKPVAVGGVAPTLRNTAANRYRYWNYQYFVTNGAPQGAVAQYINYVRSPAVQRRIVATVAVPVR